MEPSWKAVCRIRDVLPHKGVRVARGLAWQELPGVALCQTEDGKLRACLEGDDARVYSIKVEGEKIYLDANELNAPASRAEAALAGHFAVAPHV
ncbi:hypothetical protein [Massilia sp. CF038]|uniref:hypothetical protein n=1 Tax=Massilia sp. CF038 TaxID=1881045 RepID=UPI0009194346|nr:hypothetical protein [Massilia sp. CF038]SHG38860.1 nitrite reductase (NADH) small subunit [Massilia sp. CF038]